MGSYLLCRRPPASVPFHIESLHLNIYSVEELCYFMSTNLALADEVTKDPVLALWLSQECGYEEKIREYEALATDDRTGSRRIYWIFVKSHYFSENQLKKLKLQMEELDGMTPAVREKARGDALIRNRKYLRCISCYEQVLDSLMAEEAAEKRREQAARTRDLGMDFQEAVKAVETPDGYPETGNTGERAVRFKGTPEERSAFKAGVYYNLGCACARLFQGGRAAECFREAYAAAPSDAYRDAFLMACYLEGGGSRLKEEGKRLKLTSEEMEGFRTAISGVKGKPVPLDPEKALQGWIRDYHFSVDQ